MSSFNIYEDQENRVPLHERGLKNGQSLDSNVGLRPHSFVSFQNANQKSNVLQNKRTVLSSISVNSSSIRVQPRRAAKQVTRDSLPGWSPPPSSDDSDAGIQGVSYESGAPLHTSGAEKVPFVKAKTLLTASSTVPSVIHEDSSSSSSSSSSLWPLVLKPSPSESGDSSRGAEAESESSSSVAGCLVSQERAKLRPITVELPQSPVKNRSKGKSKISEVKRSSNSAAPASAVETPEAMDVSVCDGANMTVDTPSVLAALPREDILQRKNLDFWDVPEYAPDIYNYLKEAEICHKPRENYMAKQTDITASMRWILVDWLVEVSEEYSLHGETLFLAVSYIDRFLSHMSVKRDKLQLVGTTAMFIASKYEEIYPPDVSQFAYITDNTYRVSQILRMEHLILKVLSFDMAVPTALLFVNYFTKMCSCDEETRHLAMFLAELSMLDCDPFLRFLPSMIAASAVALANHTRGKVVWPDVAVKRSHYSLDDLRECYVNLHRSFCRLHAPSQHAIRDKYKAAKWHSVSMLSPIEKFPW